MVPRGWAVQSDQLGQGAADQPLNEARKGLSADCRCALEGKVSFRSHGALMKYATDRPYADPEKAARRLMEHAVGA